MPKTLFRGAFIRHADLRYDESSSTLWARVHVTSDFTDTLQETFGWGELPPGATSMKLDTALMGSSMILRPNGKELEKHELQIGIGEVRDFQVARVSGKEDEADHEELRFVVKTSEPDAISKIEGYCRSIGRGMGSLQIRYAEQAALGDVDDAPNPETPEQARLMDAEFEDPEADDDGNAPALAMAATMRGRK